MASNTATLTSNSEPKATLYVEGGDLKYRGTTGTVTTLGRATP